MLWWEWGLIGLAVLVVLLALLFIGPFIALRRAHSQVYNLKGELHAVTDDLGTALQECARWELESKRLQIKLGGLQGEAGRRKQDLDVLCRAILTGCRPGCKHEGEAPPTADDDRLWDRARRLALFRLPKDWKA